ncbi:MAG: MmcQ/YjbR family DNA-binding protein [Thermoanaerobaculia bacterium]
MPKSRSSPRGRAGKDRLSRVSEICAALPEVSRETHGSHATFRVRKKVFAYFLDNHHGDGIVSVCVKTTLGENRDLARGRPQQFYMPAYIGPRGWVGVRLDGSSISWEEIAAFIKASFCMVAPKTLVAAVRNKAV